MQDLDESDDEDFLHNVFKPVDPETAIEHGKAIADNIKQKELFERERRECREDNQWHVLKGIARKAKLDEERMALMSKDRDRGPVSDKLEELAPAQLPESNKCWNDETCNGQPNHLSRIECQLWIP